MTLTIGIAGLPNVDKSTIFNALTHTNVLTTNYPFVAIEPSVGVVPLPDKRLGALAKIFNSQRIMSATVSFADITGIVKGAPKGESLGSQFLADIREAGAICQVTRAFTNPDVVHVEGKVDPASGVETIPTELVLVDLQTLEKTTPRLYKEVSGKRTPEEVLTAAEQYKKILNPERTLSSAITAGELDRKLIREFQLMTSKPFTYVLDMDAKSLADQAKRGELAASVAPIEAVFLDGTSEAGLVELDEADTREILADAGLQEFSLGQLAYVEFATLGLQTFLTAGEKESHAWMIHRGWTVPQATGVIRTDFEHGFIKADIINYDDLVEIGGLYKVRELDKICQEGKDYVMQNGNVVESGFNV